MQLQEMNICPNCGGKMKNKEGRYDCLYCGKSFREENIAERLAEVKKELGGVVSDALMVQRMEDIANARRNLYAAIHEEYIDSGKVLQCSREIKKYLSDDVQANFYETACASGRGVNKFIENIDLDKYGYLAQDIAEFMLKSLEKHNVLPLKDFIDKAFRLTDNDKFVEYTTRIEAEAEKLDAGIYRADFPRDVFLAYSSADMKTVNEITEYLEGQGLRCYVAARNLRHGKGSVENYENNLKTAMRNCKCVVFLSSERSRSLDCDALKVELPYIKETLPEMGKIEYIAEEYKNTPSGVRTYLKEFFKGLEYCRTKEDLVNRVLNLTVHSGKGQTEKYCKACGSKNPLNVKFCGECGNKEFLDTYEEYVKIKTEEKVRQEYADKIEREKAELAAKAEQERLAREHIKQEADKEKAKLAEELERMKAELEKERAKKSTAPVAPPVEKKRVAQDPSRSNRNNFAEHIINGKPISEQTVEELMASVNTVVASVNKSPAQKPKASAPLPKASGASSSQKFEIQNGVLVKYNGMDEEITIPSGVTRIGERAFQGKIVLREVTIPSAVKSIGQAAFQGCRDLIWLTLSDGLEAIEEMAFCDCVVLQKAVIPNSVVRLGASAFCGCSQLKEVKLPDGIKKIDTAVFSSCTSLTDVTVPDGVTEIGDWAFSNCKGLKNISIPESVTMLRRSAFSNCAGLTKIEIPNGVTEIGQGCFAACSPDLTIVCKKKGKYFGKDWNGVSKVKWKLF